MNRFFSTGVVFMIGAACAVAFAQTRNTIVESARQIPLAGEADVVVVGGGPAGFAAAVAASREGCDVLLLERGYFLGGLFTGCGVTPIINMFHLMEDGSGRQAVFGIAEELCRKLDDAGMLCYEGIRPKVDPEAAKYFMEELCALSGVRILYGVQAAGVTRAGDAVDSVILEVRTKNKEGVLYGDIPPVQMTFYKAAKNNGKIYFQNLIKKDATLGIPVLFSQAPIDGGAFE